MNSDNQKDKIQTAEVLLACSDLDETLRFYTDTLGFRVDAIFPADQPKTAVFGDTKQTWHIVYFYWVKWVVPATLFKLLRILSYIFHCPNVCSS